MALRGERGLRTRSLLGAYRRRVRGTDQVVDPNTGFLRFAGDEVGVEHFVGGPGAVTFLGVDPDVCPALFDEVAQVPAFTVTPEMALTHLRIVRGRRRGADDVTIEALALELLGRRGTAPRRRQLVLQADDRRPDADPSRGCELLHRPGRKIGLVEIARTIGCSPYHLSRSTRSPG